ncbi:glyoxalase [Gammaproteobacteria bacterium]|nr:glyoxalase [Gammaproteobacteria bacterium]
MTISKIDHVQLAMPAGREREAREFYAGVLELEEVPKPPELAKRGGAWFEKPGIKLHLGVDADFRPARKAHPAFLVTDVVGLASKCRDAGYEVVDDDALAGFRRIYVHDPFGNRLEFMEPDETPHA